MKNKGKIFKLTTHAFTLIELLAVILILTIVSLIAVPIILRIITDVKKRAFDVEVNNIIKAAELYLAKNYDNIPNYEEHYIPMTELKDHLSKFSDKMLNEYVIVKKTDNEIKYYYTGKDKNPYINNVILKQKIDNSSTNNIKNIKVNGKQVNKVTGTKDQKTSMKNWVWYSGQLWQVLETTDDYIKLITANSITSIAYGPNNEWNTSWVRKWLNEIDNDSNEDGVFYNNLSRRDLLLSEGFCLDEPTKAGNAVVEENYNIDGETRKKVTDFDPINNCVNVSTDKIGLMTFEDYVYSLDGNKATGTIGGSYIDEDELSWTMTKYSFGGVNDKVWHTYYRNPSHIEKDWNSTTGYGKGVRPVIYLSSKLKVEDNKDNNYGTINNPYRLIGEQILEKAMPLNVATVGSFIYLDETNNPSSPLTEVITSRLSGTYNKTKVRYRIIGINNDGSIKVQRSDVLRELPNDIAMTSNTHIPYYYKKNACDYSASINTACHDHNYFRPDDGNGNYAFMDGENIAFYLNNADNSYYNWLSDKVKSKIVNANWNLSIGAYERDYTESLYNTNYTGNYPNRVNDGIVKANIGLPQWGAMFSGNDLNKSYWYINRWPGSHYYVSYMHDQGIANGVDSGFDWLAVRPVLNLTSNIRVLNGEGTIANPYVLDFDL